MIYRIYLISLMIISNQVDKKNQYKIVVKVWGCRPMNVHQLEFRDLQYNCEAIIETNKKNKYARDKSGAEANGQNLHRVFHFK